MGVEQQQGTAYQLSPNSLPREEAPLAREEGEEHGGSW